METTGRAMKSNPALPCRQKPMMYPAFVFHQERTEQRASAPGRVSEGPKPYCAVNSGFHLETGFADAAI